MFQPRSSIKASHWGAFFVVTWLLCGQVLADSCQAFHADEWVQVAYVYDGDTVKLADGRHIRLIGINTPEVGHDGRPSEPLAEEARTVLQQSLAPDSTIALRFDAEKQDRHGRLLAHAYLRDQRSIEVMLLQQGLAAAVVISPNTFNLDCYQAAEAQARRASLGIWRLARYQGIDSAAMARDSGGFYLVSGVVERVGESKNFFWLNLPAKVVARVDKRDLHYFNDVLDIKALQGKKIRLRGWWAVRRGELQMQLSHPAMLELLTN